MGKYKVKLEIGKFYYAYGGSKHPALIFEYDEKHKTYKSIKFGTTKAKNMIEIHPLDSNTVKQFVQKRPFEGVRSDYGEKELKGFKIDPRDNEVINKIKKNETRKSNKAKLRYRKNKTP